MDHNLASKNKVTQSELIRLIKKHYAKYAIPITIPSFILSLILKESKYLKEN